MAILKRASLFCLLSVPAIVTALSCPPVGPVFPIPTAINPVHPKIIELKHTLDTEITQKFQLLQQPPQNDNVTSFSVTITSLQENLYEYHHTAPVLGKGSTSKVTGDTGYRIASISKTVTTLALLLQGKCMDDPITKYVPELRYGQNPGGVEWSQITLKDLASHLAGVARDYASDLASVLDAATATNLGFPPVDPSSFAPCGKNATDIPCTREQFFKGIKNTTAIYYPDDRSSYSNLGFEILGYALESIAGNSYEEIIQGEVFKPLGMSQSSSKIPRDGTGVIPAVPNDWYTNVGHGTAAGGIYSTSNDLSRYMRGIMNYKILPGQLTRNWLKPVSFTSSRNTAYGTPWEIFRTDKESNVTSDGRIIEAFTKSGDLGGYHSWIVMVPEFGYGITILVAGLPDILSDILDITIRESITTFDKIAREQTQKAYTGTYSSRKHEELESKITFTVDDGPGLRVTNFISRGKNVFDALKVHSGVDASTILEVRLFPTGVVNGNGNEQWRLLYEFISPNSPPVQTAVLFGDGLCFGDIGGPDWGGQPLMEIEFIRNRKDMQIVGIDMVGFRLSLTKDVV